MSTKVKICGIRTPDAMTAALEAGADFVGLVFHPASPRYVDIEVASYLAAYVPDHIQVVGLFADTPPDILETILSGVRIDMLQLHGQESPDTCAALKETYKRPVMKALPLRLQGDLAKAAQYEEVCDWLLFDAPPPEGADRPGGHGEALDWNLLSHHRFAKPWMLAGGLTPANVAEAIRLTHPAAVDVSSGVETAPGVKDADKIRAFIASAKAA